jgi:hypothetical protein
MKELVMEKAKSEGNPETAKAVCVDCSCTHGLAIDMSKSGAFDPCQVCLLFKNIYKVVR